MKRKIFSYLVILSFVFTLLLPASAPVFATIDPNVSIDKTATETPDQGIFQVQLTVDGIPVPKPIDAILVVDVSGSMGDGSPTSLYYAQEAAKTFASSLLSPPGNNNRVAIVSYHTTSALVQGLTSNLGDVNSAIDSLHYIDWTNIEAGFVTASTHMSTYGRDPANTNRVIILLSDGCANAYLADSSIGEWWPTSSNAYTQAAVAAGVAAQAQATVFTIGLLGYIHNNPDPGIAASEGVAASTLNNAQNGGYFQTYLGADLSGIYLAIVETITNVGTNAIVTDYVTSEFDIVPGSIVTSQGSAVADYVNKVITWDVGTISDTPATLTYRISAIYPWVSGLHDTNISADLTYTDINGNPTGQTFPVPDVTLPPFKGSISILKLVPGSEAGIPLQGVGFTIKQGSTVIRPEAYTDTEGKLVFSNLDSGTYDLYETFVPQGFIGSSEYLYGKAVNVSDNEIISLVIYNTAAPSISPIQPSSSPIQPSSSPEPSPSPSPSPSPEEPSPAPEESPVPITEPSIPAGPLPKTGGLPAELLYGLGAILTGAGFFLKRKSK